VPWIIAGGVLVVVVLIAHAVIVIKVARMLEHTPPFNVDEPNSKSGVEEVTFPTSDDLTLHGCLFRQPDRTSKGLVVFCHELGSNCWSAMRYCSGLMEAGFDVFAFDFRNHGSSDSLPKFDPLHWLSEYELNDIQAALKFVAERQDLKDQPLGLFGISRGAGASLAVAAQRNDIKCIACEGTYSSHLLMSLYSERWVSLFAPAGRGDLYPQWHVEITLAGARWLIQRKRHFRFVKLERYLPKLKDRNILMIVGKRDSYARPEIAKKIYSELESENSNYWMVSGARHNQAREIDPTGYDNQLTTFFEGLSPEDVPTTVPVLAESSLK
jgi:alpha-beta hydrolase superfamily lysophospholipase